MEANSRITFVNQLASRLRPLLRVLGSAPLAYLLLALLQMCVLRGYWSVKDVTTGDTSHYFLDAVRWNESYRVNIIWSPLYTAYFGTMLSVTGDTVQAVLWHRVLIVFAASLLTLAVLRRLLPPGWAWLTAAWWAVLPINFDTLYEVHLFALLPLLAMWLLLARDSAWARASALAVLGCAVVLVRNEMSVPFILLLGYCAVREIATLRRTGSSSVERVAKLAVAYAVPLIVGIGFCGFAYSRSTVHYPETKAVLREKHTLNMAQVYAFGYQQRHPEWTRSPWTEYHDLTMAHFGVEKPSLRQMLANNPQAVAEHFAWNLGLTPSGLQVLLFNAAAGDVNPDYNSVKLGRSRVWVQTALLLTCWTVGLVLLVRHRQFWWRAWLRKRCDVWVGMLAVAAVVPLVICTQRPRPSYLFGLSVLLMAITGMSAFIVAHHLRMPRSWRQWSPLAALMVIAIVLLLPRYFQTSPGLLGPRPLATRLERLEPFSPLYREPAMKILQGEYAWEVNSYLGYGKCQSLANNVLRNDWPTGMPLEEFLDSQEFNAIYLEEFMLHWLQTERAADARSFLSAQSPREWQLLGNDETPGARWRLYQRVPSAAEMASNADDAAPLR